MKHDKEDIFFDNLNSHAKSISSLGKNFFIEKKKLTT